MDGAKRSVKVICQPGLFLVVLIILIGCAQEKSQDNLRPKISLVNAPDDIVTLGANFIADELKLKSEGRIQPRVFHSGVLSGGKGTAEIEMCQQGSIEMHVTTTAYLANMVPRASVFSLPFLFRDLNQVSGLARSHSAVLDTINKELNEKNLHIIAWWPRGFRQLTNSRRMVRIQEDLRGLRLRVMNNPLFVDNLNAMGANPVPMAWGEVYNALQLRTIDGQENAEDVIYSSRLYEVQEFMTIWDYSTDLEVVIVNLEWWNDLSDDNRSLIQKVADASTEYQEDLLKKNTEELRKKIAENGMQIYYLSEDEKNAFRTSVQPVWARYEEIFKKPFLDAFLAEVQKY